MSHLRISNTLTGKKDIIKPIKGKKLNLFVCGPTVYDYSHIGHARNYIFFDTFVKYLKSKKLDVFYLQNITDVDDKIIVSSREKGVSPQNLALAFEKEYLKDMKSLSVTSISKYARATAHIKEIIKQIEGLQKKGYAYEIKGDGIYFNITKFKNYGALSKRSALQAEDSVSRIDYSRDKINRGDFCLWKFRQEEEVEPSWDSPFGKGRPGWHIEDTAITEKFFGPQYDIHGGAIDLIFPHHEAEIAQMEALSGKKPLAKYWMHVGFLTVDGQKMGKSLNNSITIQDFLRRYSVTHLRFFVLKSFWKSPIDYSESLMIEVKSALEKIEEFLKKIKNNKTKIKQNAKFIADFKKEFYDILDDDFNTPKAFGVMFDFIKEMNILLDKNLLSEKSSQEIYDIFEELNKIFGFIDFKKVKATLPSIIKKLLQERKIARQTQNWQKADQLRLAIEKHGYTIEDLKEGVIVKKR